MASGEIDTAPGERGFGIDELFFSTTDTGGRILTGNPIFTRVSGYALDEMRGKAHNIVRHRDMPRVVFRLLWSYLGEGRPIAAYVKNRAKDGRAYWVVAIVVAIPDGYLSVRFKPSSPHFEVVAGLYEKLLRIEKDIEDGGGLRDAAMDASQAELGRVLASLGLPDYDRFMQTVLTDELTSREALLADSPAWRTLWNDVPRPDPADPRRATLIETLERFRAAHARMDALYGDIADYARLNDALSGLSRDLAGDVRLQSLNMLLGASRLGERGASLSVVAQLMSSEARSAGALTDALNRHADGLHGTLRDLGFRIAVGRLQAEMAVFFSQEMLRSQAAGDAPGDDVATHVALLAGALADGLGHIGAISRGVGGALDEMGRHMQALTALLGVLQVLQLNGTVEAARFDEAQAVHQLLAEMSQEVQTARAQIAQLEKVAAAARARARNGADEDLEGELLLMQERAVLSVA